MIPFPLDLNLLVILFVSLGAILLMFYLISTFLHVESHSLFIITSGVIVGLVIGGLLSVPLSKLPGVFGQWLPTIVTLMFVTVVATIFYARREGFIVFTSHLRNSLGVLASLRQSTGSKIIAPRSVLLDTSVIIDGRIEELAKTGFVPLSLVVPRFVLHELQSIADSSISNRRERGRRGLDILASLKKLNTIKLEIIDDDFAETAEVDQKLVRLAKEKGWDIMTTDFNLNKVASVEGVRVLNINDLATSLRPIILPGEQMQIEIVQPGKEKKQGVGYLNDGTMVVVESGDKHIGQEVTVKVTRVFQTPAGKMIFAGMGKEDVKKIAAK